MAVAAVALAWAGLMVARYREESHRLDVLLWSLELDDDQAAGRAPADSSIT